MKQFLTSLIFIVVFYFSQAQNVGIGTTTPAAKLDVKATSSYVAQLNGAAPMYMGIFENDIYRGYWGSYSGNPEDVDFGTGSGSSGKLHLTIQASPKLTIDAGGKVGIGTTSPGYILDVANRMRLNQGTLNNIFTTPGVWLTDYRDGTDRMFIGMQDSIRWGIFGGGTGGMGWGFNFSAKTGNVNIGNTTGETYRLQLSGSNYGIGMYNQAGNFYGSMTSDGSDNLVIESPYYSIFGGGTPAKDILLNPPSGTIFFSPGNVGVNTSTPNARFHVGGTVYIGTSTGVPAAGYQLSVKGKIISEEVKVSLSSSWPDYVFSNNYNLMPLEQLEQSINNNKHLPNIPAAAEVEKNGIMLGDMNKRLMEKVEELTLYIIDINKKNTALTEKVDKLEKQLNNHQ